MENVILQRAFTNLSEALINQPTRRNKFPEITQADVMTVDMEVAESFWIPLNSLCHATASLHS